MNDRPIGLFDSGIGGTSIWREINQLLPFESTIYLADSKNAPYGEKSPEEIVDFSLKNTKLLLDYNCKLIVVACNTATTNAITLLREKYPVKFIGIEPAIKPAALNTKAKKVGILATKGTLTSELFQNTSKLHASGIEIFEQEGNGLVELIEAGKAKSEETLELLEKYVRPMLKSGIDSLVLGCTHYPYLIPVLRKILPPNIEIIDSGFAVAKQTKSVLARENLLNPSKSVSNYRFFTNTDVKLLKDFIATKSTIVEYLDF